MYCLIPRHLFLSKYHWNTIKYNTFIWKALYFNKPIIATNIRGNKDLISKTNGVLVDNLDDMIKLINNNKNIKFHKCNINDYLLPNVIDKYKSIVNKYLKDKLK